MTLSCSFWPRVAAGLLLSALLAGVVAATCYMSYPYWKWIFFVLGCLAFPLPLVAAYLWFVGTAVKRGDPSHLFQPLYLLAYIIIVVLLVGGGNREAGVYYDLHHLMTRIFLLEACAVTIATLFLWIFPCLPAPPEESELSRWQTLA